MTPSTHGESPCHRAKVGTHVPPCIRSPATKPNPSLPDLPQQHWSPPSTGSESPGYPASLPSSPEQLGCTSPAPALSSASAESRSHSQPHPALPSSPHPAASAYALPDTAK